MLTVSDDASATVARVDPLAVVLIAAIVAGWAALFALWWFVFRAKP
jgi:hypothetical protein